jgi:putative nucleotidyltransferase with HDIG domain
MLMEADLDDRLREYIKKMPSLPTSITKVMEICNNPHTSPADLNHVISLDPVLVGRVLKLLNSAYYGLGQPISNLVRAIIMLGVNTVKNLALSTTVIEHLSRKKSLPGLDMEGFWRHSLCVGVSAKLLAKKRGIDTKLLEEYFTAGLLHDIGKIPLNAALSKEYMLTISTADRERKPLSEVEKSTLGLNHCEAGAKVSEAWKLDGAIGDTIIHHHSYSEYSGNYKDLLYTVAAANRFSSLAEIGFSGDRHPIPLPGSIWEALKVSKDVFDEIEENVSNEIEKAEVFLKIGHIQ